MQLPDLINGIFELGGAFINSYNVRSIRKDKGYAGVSWYPWAWFSGWGLWNLYYYPHLDQWLSFCGGCLIVAINLTWLHYAFYYGPVGGSPSSRYHAFVERLSLLRKLTNGRGPEPQVSSQVDQVVQA